jgi:hypothetical protein
MLRHLVQPNGSIEFHNKRQQEYTGLSVEEDGQYFGWINISSPRRGKSKGRVGRGFEDRRTTGDRGTPLAH